MSKPEETNVVEAESGNESEDGKKLSGNYMVTPAYMTAVMRRQFLQEMVKNLPAPLQNRVTVMKNIQLEYLKLESEFFKEVYELEKKYHEKYQPLYDRRKDIVSGAVDPPKEEPKWKVEEEEESGEIPEEFVDVLKQFKELSTDTGLPNFWLTIFKNTELISQMIQEHDEPVLKKLIDIKIKYDNDYSYTLEFHFDKNEYFTNPVLTKQYFLKVAVDAENPFAFDGPEIYKCKGCQIDWEKKMNLTIKTIRKKQKHKEHGAVRTIVKTVPNDSFFNFFDPPQVPEDKEDVDEDVQEILATDFEIGHFLRARIIPNAVLYYTGDVIDDDDDDDEEYDEEDDDDDDDDDQQQQHPNRGSGGKKKPMPNECPNQ